MLTPGLHEYRRIYRLSVDLMSHGVQSCYTLDRWSRGDGSKEVSIPFLERSEPWVSERFSHRIEGAGEWNYLHLDVEGTALVRVDGSIVGGIDYFIKTIPCDTRKGSLVELELQSGGSEPWTHRSFRGIIDAVAMRVVDETLAVALFTLDLAKLALGLDKDRSSHILSSLLDSLEHVRVLPPPREWQLAASYKLLYGSRSISSKKDAPDPRWDHGLVSRTMGFLGECPSPRMAEAEVLGLARKVWDSIVEGLEGLVLSGSDIYALAHSHLDVAWLWPFKSTRHKALRTFANMVSVLRRVGIVTGGLDSPQNYKLAEEGGLLESVKSEISKGRLIPLGGLWVEPDTWAPTGETLARELLHGQKYYEEKIGRRARIAMLLDTFGLSPQLPQLLTSAGLEAVITHKMMWNDTTKFPLRSFAWTGLDGSQIPAHVAVTYDGGATLTDLVRNLELHGKASKTPLLYLYSYGDGGGGPTVFMALRMKKIWESGLFPRLHISMTESDLTARLRAVEGRWHGEIYNEYHRGVYSSDPRVKGLFSSLEACLLKLDYWLSILKIARIEENIDGAARRSKSLWEVLLRSAFHDIVTGSSSREASEYSQKELVNALETCSNELSKILSLISRRINGTGGFVVFNPHGWNIEIGGHAIPMHGYSLLKEPPSQETAGPAIKEAGKLFSLSNRMVSVEVDTRGLIRSIKAGGVEMISGPSNRVRVHPNRPGEFDAWEIDYVSLLKGDDLAMEALSTASGARLSFRAHFRDSSIEVFYTLPVNKPFLQIEYTLEWSDEGYLVKSWFQLPPSHEALFEVPFGFVRRSIDENSYHYMGRFELPFTRWFFYPIDGSGYTRAGIGFVSTTRHGASVTRGTIGLTVHLAPTFPNPYNGIGRFHYRYLLVPLNGKDSAVEMARIAREEHVGFNVVEKLGKGGELPARGSIIRQEGDAIIESLKPSWDLEGVVARVYDPTGRGSTMRLKLPSKATIYESNIVEDKVELLKKDAQELELMLSPFEIKTLYIKLE
ncbi:MAG: glycosyl hydrolase-related protein [Desulfurococcales archaeon]|nr:glycosyl hydrolase-related protein [Desulfurococcales archaeon]